MEKAQVVIDKQKQKIDQFGHPRLDLLIQSKNQCEGFSCHYAAGAYRLEAKSPQSASFAMHCLEIGIASGHAAELLGEWHPRFPLRPLWMSSSQQIALDTNVSVFVPEYLSESAAAKKFSDLDLFCETILHLGYNSVLFGNWNNALKTCSDRSPAIFRLICEHLHSYGIKVLVKPAFSTSHCCLDPDASASVIHSLKYLSKLSYVDSIFWESNCWSAETQNHPFARDYTEADLVQAEINMLRHSVNSKSVIYYIPCADADTAARQAQWLPSLCDDMPQNFILAFSAVAGNFFDDHLHPHPFWSALRCSPDESATPLMPIINLGAVWQGECLWPSLSLDLIDRYIDACCRHHFAGVIGLVNQLPAKNALLECNLWTASQLLWGRKNSLQIAETWFAAKFPAARFDYTAFLEVRKIILKLSLLRSLEQNPHHITQEECRALVDSIISKLKHLHFSFEKINDNELKKYFALFVKDARLITLRAFQNMQIPLLHLKKDEDADGGIWIQGLLGEMGKFKENAKR